jgi:hypothetical protein
LRCVGIYLSGYKDRLHWCCLRCPLSYVRTLVRQYFQTSAFLAVVYDVLMVSFRCYIMWLVVLFVLFCFVLFCFVLFCFVLFCFVLFCFVRVLIGAVVSFIGVLLWPPFWINVGLWFVRIGRLGGGVVHDDSNSVNIIPVHPLS